MNAADRPISSDARPPKILLIGDIGKALLDASDISKSFEVHACLPDGISAAARDNFAAIAVVMSGTSGRISSTLKALREAGSNAKIILLAQMYEEPKARQHVWRVSRISDTSAPASSCRKTGAGADDYLICPIHSSQLQSYILRLIGCGPPRLPVGRQERGDITTKDRQQGNIGVSAIDTKAKKKIELLEKLVTEDDLTSLKNRRYIWEFSRQIIEHARGENGRVTLLVFDIDDFKQYNDLYGHRAGDQILRQAAVLMRRCCRQHDVVGRIGGDEFAVVFWDDPLLLSSDRKTQGQPAGTETERRSAMADHPEEAIFIAKRFVSELEKVRHDVFGGSAFSGLGPAGKGILTISGGLASYPRDGATIQELFQRADEALLEAKRSGKNRIYLVGKPPSDIADTQ
jgi:GGDEF domain-containing protein